ncbi:hypothetical protein [Actinoplanes sp. NPDC051859]|uniref:hypothetical protein n=1 Tax=Actinoplanes sp. NPDC051859 TaxID=3363909 RepID=UPI0037A8E696
MTVDALSDVASQRFEHDFLHRPEETRKTLTTCFHRCDKLRIRDSRTGVAFGFLDDATSLTSDRTFGFIAGVPGGLVVATI